MKKQNSYYKFYSILALIFLWCTQIFAQCPPAGLTITNQAQVDNFIIMYPNCTEINGDLIIDEANITSLAGFANVTSITGALEIREVPNLQNLNGLQNLENVGTDFILREVDNLADISALSALTSVGGEFTVRSCPDLVNLDGVENLTTVGLGLIIRECSSLISIEGLIGVTTIGEILEVVENPLLAGLSGLENIIAVAGGEEGALVIEGNDSLTTLNGLGSANTIFGGSIVISTNGELSYCSVPSICNYLQNIPEGAIADIGLNVTGCNSDTEILAACEPLIVPTVTGFTPESGCVGTEIVITGTGFSTIQSVTIGGTSVAGFVVNSTSQITVTIGAGTTGNIEVTNTAGSAVSVGTFTVTPSPDAPTGNSVQLLNATATEIPVVADLEADLTEGGIIIWYASEADAMSGENALPNTTPLINGTTYYATQTVGDCTSTEFFEVIVEIVLASDSFSEVGLKLYPNPVKDEAYLILPEDISADKVVLHDMNGRVIKQWEVTVPELRLNMQGIVNGLYILSVNGTEGRFSHRLIVE